MVSETSLPLGMTRCTKRCVEFGSVSVGGCEEDSAGDGRVGGVRVLAAWFGDADDVSQRRDITREVLGLLAQYGPGVEVSATTALWGDPACFRVKRLEVTYEYDWLTPEERGALEALQRRANEKAQSAADLEELVSRLGNALLAAVGHSAFPCVGSRRDAVDVVGAAVSDDSIVSLRACGGNVVAGDNIIAASSDAGCGGAEGVVAASDESRSTPLVNVADTVASNAGVVTDGKCPEAKVAATAGYGDSSSSVAAQAPECTPSTQATSSSSRPPSPLGCTSPRWKCLGFQSCDPRTDLRTGRLAVEALIYLADSYPEVAKQMVVEAQSDRLDYPFAVASINVTQLLARYLRLISDGGNFSNGLASASWQAPQQVVRRFSRLLVRRDGEGEIDDRHIDPFGEFHAAAMVRLHASWRATKEMDPRTTVMNFPSALDEMMNASHEFCVSCPLRSALEFRTLATFGCAAPTPALQPGSPTKHPGSPASLCLGRGHLATQALSHQEDPQDGTLLATVGRGARAFSDAAGVAGTYLRGILAGPLVPVPSPEQRGIGRVA
eukprot:TRINITY_DN21109_c0_g1_i1.p1 TRINITY_DN21109_c0_g1~~TRINITY_DN21109_c0_g1_i1.p1  ORF type:complete len:572 (+),score=114.14 TRINITY_DN21109_c0_g1_i1:59-1717(+)